MGFLCEGFAGLCRPFWWRFSISYIFAWCFLWRVKFLNYHVPNPNTFYILLSTYQARVCKNHSPGALE